MKRACVGCVIMVVVAAASLSAQEIERKNELYAGYGAVSVLDLMETLTMDAISVVSNIANPFSVQNSEIDKSYGPIIVGYNYYHKSWLSLGPVLNYDNLLVRNSYLDGSRTTYYFHNISLMFRLEFHYANFKYVQLYSGFSLGGALVVSLTADKGNGFSFLDTYSKSKTHVGGLPAGQVNLLGIRIGTDFAFYIELGFGYNGLVNAGFSGKF